jgi:capsular exopolysaccharide synthesis family protein
MEGKTFLAVSLGSVIASEGKRVLVVDGDMRKGRIHEVFKAEEDGSGLSDVISGKSTELKTAIRESGIPGLYYMPSGPTPDNPVALIKAPRMQALLDTIKKEFDCVILDSPPVLGVVDARILCGFADGLILVTRAGHVPIEMLKQAKEAVTQGETRLLGIVLNMSDPRSDGYSHYYTGKYGRYYARYYHSSSYHSLKPAGSKSHG